MRARPLVAAATAALLSAGLPAAEAKRAPQIIDPRGDVVVGGAAYDVLTTTFDTNKRVSIRWVNGRKITTITPLEVVITLELAGQPTINPGTSYQVAADSETCGTMYAWAFYDVIDQKPKTRVEVSSCSTDRGGDLRGYEITHQAYLGSNAIQWRIPLSALPRQMQLGEVLHRLEAYTAPNEPFDGNTLNDFLPAEQDPHATFDHATTEKTYRLGS